MASVPTPPSGLLEIRNAQACCSCETLAEEITEAGACRVLARSAFGYGHEPDGGVALGLVVVADCVAVTVGLPEVLQAAAAKATRTASTLSPTRVCLVGACLVRVCPVRLEVGIAPLLNSKTDIRMIDTRPELGQP